MSNWNILTYAVSGLEMCAADITHTFVNFIVSKFPYGTFKKGTIFVDTMGLVNDHKRRETGLENPSKVLKPFMTVTTEGGLTDQWSRDDGGPDIRQWSMFPGTTTDRRLQNSHRLGMIHDREIGLLVDTIEIRRKLNLIFRIEFDSKADLNTMKSYIYNTISIGKFNYLNNLKTNIILPNSLINDISRLAFDRNNFSLSNHDDVKALEDYMNEKGLFDFHSRVKDVDDSSVWFLMDRIMRLNYYIPLIEAKDGDNADKIGEVYDKFTLELNAELNMKLPNSYIMNYKIFNGPNKAMISNEYFNNVKSDEKCNIPISFTNSRYIEDREYIKPIDKGYKLIVREEFLISNEEEQIGLAEFFPNNSIYRLALERLKPYERRDLFQAHIYENTTIIEDSNCTVEDIKSDIIYTIKGCNTNVSFMIFIYCNLDKLKNLLNIIHERYRKSIFPNRDDSGNILIVGSNPPKGIDPDKMPFEIWSNETEYEEGAIVFHNNVLYRATESNVNIEPSLLNQDESDIKWKLVAKYWYQGLQCNEGEFIIYKSLLYVTTINNNDKIPNKDYDYFRFVVLLGGYLTDFEFKLIFNEISIGGKYIGGGHKYSNGGKSRGTIENFFCNIYTVRNIDVV
ncbi:MAG: hypothetical protein ACOCZ5_01445 [bacterium]